MYDIVQIFAGNGVKYICVYICKIEEEGRKSTSWRNAARPNERAVAMLPACSMDH